MQRILLIHTNTNHLELLSSTSGCSVVQGKGSLSWQGQGPGENQMVALHEGQSMRTEDCTLLGLSRDTINDIRIKDLLKCYVYLISP